MLLVRFLSLKISGPMRTNMVTWLWPLIGSTIQRTEIPSTYRAALLSFHRLSGRHTGKNLDNIVLSILDRAKITFKAKYIYSGWFYLVLTIQIGYFTMDNAENNTMMMKSLKGLLHKRDLNFWCQGASSFLLSPHRRHLHWACCIVTQSIS